MSMRGMGFKGGLRDHLYSVAVSRHPRKAIPKSLSRSDPAARPKACMAARFSR